MKSTIEFNLPEERNEFDTFLAGSKYHSVLWELYNWLRSQWKYDAGDIDGDVAEVVWQKVCDLMEEEEVSIP